ncbi:head-tail connector protein [Halopseudomonas salina]|uniref:Phage gp6-like head-tail connector protein n=1 Tax=Halopseudomonas salina TaxID=1323744 RepID=A0ABQ1NYV2_9GAMM|nr:head-tail connector protein [Halopseudomonas salina]GGC87397.1 hypothetical protein GCM10007418_03930 [Halopseudomonas salina]
MLNINAVKAHLRVRHDQEDEYIAALVEAAVQAFDDQTNRKLVATAEELPDPVTNEVVLNKAIEQGALLLIGQWYSNREAVVLGTIVAVMPQATNALWGPYRWVNIG